MKVDNTSVLKFPDRRNSIRINTSQRYTIGTLWVVDMLHAPWGVSSSYYSLRRIQLKRLSSALYGPRFGRQRRHGHKAVKSVR